MGALLAPSLAFETALDRRRLPLTTIIPVALSFAPTGPLAQDRRRSDSYCERGRPGDVSPVRGIGRRIGRPVSSALHWLYERSVARWTWWPLSLASLTRKGHSMRNGAGARRAQPRIAYYIWHFPVLSQTFVRREVGALRKRGACVTIFAQGVEDLELLDDDARALQESTHYVEPIDEPLLARYKKTFRWTKPLTYLNLLLFVMSRRYGAGKSFFTDPKILDDAVYLAGHLRDRGIDRVHSPWADRSGFAALLAARLLDIPFSVQVRAHDLHDPSYQGLLPDLFENADFIITNTLYNRPYILAQMRSEGPEVHTIYNGIDLAEFVPVRQPRQADAVRVLCVARLIEQKGLLHLLEACALLRERGLAFRCEVIGGTEEPLYTDYARRLTEVHRRLGLEDHVVFRGAQPFADVIESYRRADVFVLPCVVARDGRRDITPNALIEAMAMKLPVVSTTITGIPEIVENGVSGLLVPPADHVALADAIETVARDPALAAQLGENARKRVADRFDVEENVRSYLRLFGYESG